MRLVAVSLLLLQFIFVSTVGAQTAPDFKPTNDLFAEEEPEFLPEDQAFVSSSRRAAFYLKVTNKAEVQTFASSP